MADVIERPPPKVMMDALMEASHAMTAAAFELARWAPDDAVCARALQLSSAAILIRDDWMPAFRKIAESQGETG